MFGYRSEEHTSELQSLRHLVCRLLLEKKDNFYGTTEFGGTFGDGTVFELSPNGNGGWNETVLYSFCSVGANCTDGSLPFFNVIFDSVGNLYGVAQSGAYNYGVVWELSPLGENWTETVLD